MPRRLLITGGSGGIGGATVRAFAALGDIVAFTYHSHGEQAEKIARETGALPIRCDLRVSSDIRLATERVQSLMHGIDVLICCAGNSQYGVVDELSEKAWDELFQIHVKSAFLLSKAFLPSLRKRRGSILMISSIWGQTGASCEAAYSAAKAALIGLTKALAKEEAPLVRVNCIAPGVVQTAMLDRFSSDEKHALAHQIPLERFADAREIADAAVFLCSESSAYITGQTLGVNGGLYI
ncbi:MAG: SDR family oxidoreductase [Clostridia bacterium]|nr:SDR family oxidoreductase [Clostridia bacterium]